MAAISDDTLALVAAQLTTAWAIKTGIESEDSGPHTQRLVHRFDTIFDNLKQSRTVSRPVGR